MDICHNSQIQTCVGFLCVVWGGFSLQESYWLGQIKRNTSGISQTNTKPVFEQLLGFLGLLSYIWSSHSKPKQFIVNLWKARARLSKLFGWELLAFGSVTDISYRVGLLASESKVRMELEVCKCWDDLHCRELFLSVNVRN